MILSSPVDASVLYSLPMKIFASLDTPFIPEQIQNLVGRQVANSTFLEALWRFGDFDAYHFYAGDRHNAFKFDNQLRPVWEQYGLKDRVEVFSRFELIDHVKRFDYHVFHQSDFLAYFADICSFRSRLPEKRFPVTAPIHSISYPKYQREYLHLLLEGPKPYDAIVCTSRAGKHALEAAFGGIQQSDMLRGMELQQRLRLERIPLGVDTDRFSAITPDSRKEARALLDWDENEVVVLCLGRFSVSDKYDLLPLLRAFQLCFSEAEADKRVALEPARLVLAGSRQGSDYPERIQSVAKAMGYQDKVRVYTNLEPELHRALYQASDIFISPSDNLQETFGLTVLEAMASGLPMVVSDWDGYKDLVLHEVNGYRVPTYVAPWDDFLGELGPLCFMRPWHLAVAQATVLDVPAMAEALRNLILLPEKRRQFGAASRERALQFSWKAVIRQYLDLWGELKKEAAKDTDGPQPASPFAQPPLSLFPSHPSGQLDPAHLLKLTDRGQSLLITPRQGHWYQELDPLIDPTVVRHLCAMARQGSSLEDAVILVADVQAQTSARVLFQLAWAIKNDFIRTGAGK